MGKKQQQVKRQCSRCGGTGTVPVSDAMTRTLAAIGKGATLQQVAAQLKVGENTIFARAQRLMSQGLISRTTHDGRTFVYRQVGL